MNGVEQQWKGRVTVIRARIDEPANVPLLQSYPYHAIPALRFIDRTGKVVYEHQGMPPMTREQVEAVLQRVAPPVAAR